MKEVTKKPLINFYVIPILKQEWTIILTSILSSFPYVFYVYGSRSRGDCEEYSDLDLCIMTKFRSFAEKQHIKNLLASSDLPIPVDILSWESISKDFQKQIKNDLIPLFR